jgi:N-acetylglutamate synthase-like GNAT family acetyltransferase
MTTVTNELNIRLRPAIAADQPTIKAIIRAAGINPLGLKWERFLLAEDADQNAQIIGTGQIKPHGDGSHELASIAVIPAWQGQGVGSAIVRALMAQHTQRTDAPLYLICEGANESYYLRFGFQSIGRAAMPPYFRRIHRVAAILIGVGRIIRPGNTNRLVVMRYDLPRSNAD